MKILKSTTKVHFLGGRFMAISKDAGVYQLDNGYWAYRYVLTIDGKRKERKKVKDA